jgi:hypothetical protein
MTQKEPVVNGKHCTAASLGAIQSAVVVQVCVQA